MKRALITGITGQDGAYLAQFLRKKGYDVYGIYRRLSTPNFWRLHYLGTMDKINLIPADLQDFSSCLNALKQADPHEVYHLGAQSFVATSFEQPIQTSNITGIGVTQMLESIREYNSKIKFYNASSSEMYGNVKSKYRNEETAFHPASPYAAAKLYGYWMANLYKESYNMHVSNGILFNHESPLRGLEFVTRKITNEIAKISLGLEKELKLGNLTAKRDWGYAPEYVEGMWKMLQQKEPDNYVLATKETHSIKEFVVEACKTADVSMSKVKTSKQFMRPNDVEYLIGDFSKAKKKLGWSPKIKFKKLVKIMIEEDIKRWQSWLNGEHFPWDVRYTKK